MEVYNLLEFIIQDVVEARCEEAHEEGREEGREEGAIDKAIEIAKNLLQAEFPVAEVTKHVQLPFEIIEGL